MSFARLTVLTLALFAGLAMVAADVADARAGRGFSFGSRGSRTYTAPPATNTAPKAAPIERSMTQNAPGAAQAAQPSRFGGWRGILMGGLLAAAFAGIFGVGALASVLGFMLQFALIAGVVYLLVMFFRSRSQPAMAGAGSSAGASAPRSDQLRRDGFASGGSAGAPSGTLAVGQDDLDTFERLLGEIQTAYGRED